MLCPFLPFPLDHDSSNCHLSNNHHKRLIVPAILHSFLFVLGRALDHCLTSRRRARSTRKRCRTAWYSVGHGVVGLVDAQDALEYGYVAWNVETHGKPQTRTLKRLRLASAEMGGGEEEGATCSLSLLQSRCSSTCRFH